MAYDMHLADRIREAFFDAGTDAIEKQMMGGLVFMVDDKMCIGILKDEMMVRIDPNQYETLIERSGVREMDFTGRPMKGLLMIDKSIIRLDKDLKYWIDIALAYNPFARRSTKKKK